MAKKIRFPLKMKNGAEVRTLDELKENFDLESVLGYFTDGRLTTWLADRYYDEKAEAVSALSADMPDLNAKLCEILEVEYQAENDETDVELIARRREKLRILGNITDDKDVLDNVDLVAMDQDELFDILDESPEKVYLYGEKFSIPMGVKNIKYVGVNNPLLVLEKGKIVGDYNSADILFENVQFEEGVDVSAEKIYEEAYKLSKAEKYEEAFMLVKKAAEMGYVHAQAQLGILYECGTGTEKNCNEALKWYLKAVDQGSPDAMYRLGKLYSSGKDVSQDLPKAMEYFKLAAEKGDEFSCIEIGEMYYYGLGVQNRDIVEAEKWYTKAFESNNRYIQHKIIEKYENGDGIDKNISRVVRLLKKIADAGDKYALNKLGKMYYNGIGVLQSNKNAVECYEQAAEQGDAYDKYKLGEMFEEGIDVSPNANQAMRWYDIAAKEGEAFVKRCVADKYKEGKAIPRNYQKAIELYTEAAEQGDNQAKYSIYEMMYYGQGMPKDEDKALEALRNAAQAGDEDAQFILLNMDEFW